MSRYAGESSEDKRARMGKKVEEAGADIALIGAPDSIAWLLNIRGNDVPFNPLTLVLRPPPQRRQRSSFSWTSESCSPGQTFGNEVSHRSILELGRQPRSPRVVWSKSSRRSRLDERCVDGAAAECGCAAD